MTSSRRMNLTNEQGNALCDVMNTYNSAYNSRNREVLFAKNRKYQEFNQQEELTKQIKTFDKNIVKGTYVNLFNALSHPSISDHLGEEIKELKSHLAESMKTDDFSAVDKFFDNQVFKNLGNNGKGPGVELVKVADLEKTNPKLGFATRLNDFAGKVGAAIKDLFTGRAA